MMIFFILRKTIEAAAPGRLWFSDHRGVLTMLVIICSTNTNAFSIVGSKAFRSTVYLNIDLRIGNILKYLAVTGMIGSVIEDLPQITVQWIFFQLHSDSVSLPFVVSVIGSALAFVISVLRLRRLRDSRADPHTRMFSVTAEKPSLVEFNTGGENDSDYGNDTDTTAEFVSSTRNQHSSSHGNDSDSYDKGNRDVEATPHGPSSRRSSDHSNDDDDESHSASMASTESSAASRGSSDSGHTITESASV